MRLELEPDDRPDKNGWNLTTSEYKSSQGEFQTTLGDQKLVTVDWIFF